MRIQYIMAVLLASIPVLVALFVGLVVLDFQPNPLGAVLFWGLFWGSWPLAKHIFLKAKRLGTIAFLASLYDSSGTSISPNNKEKKDLEG